KAIKLAFGLEYPEETRAMLLVECDAAGPDLSSAGFQPVSSAGAPPAKDRLEACATIVDREMATVREVCARHAALEVRVAQNEAERAKMWMVRKKGIGAMGRIAPS